MDCRPLLHCLGEPSDESILSLMLSLVLIELLAQLVMEDEIVE